MHAVFEPTVPYKCSGSFAKKLWRVSSLRRSSIEICATAADILAESNFEYPSGNARDGNKELLFRTSGLFTSLDDIADTPVFYGDSGVLKIKDIGTAVFGTEKKKEFFYIQRQRSVMCKNL